MQSGKRPSSPYYVSEIIFLQEWNSNLENSPKALNYRLYKQIFEFENYFNILENKDIFTFCKFRTTNTKIPIETGRWNNIARENRKCQNVHTFDKPRLSNISFANFTQGADIFPLQKKLCKSL
jgi:hypothetical protein